MTDQTANTENPLTLYNSLTRTKERFVPQDPKRVTMYNCGPTVYSYAHIGNARAAVVADVLFRVLRHIYGEEHVVYARNITDVDDKIIAAAKEQGVDISEITEKYARIYNEDLAALGCLPPTHQPKATDNIGNMIAMIETLLNDGYAYASDGHVFFDVSKYDEYGKLSGNTLEALRGGDRVGEGEVARKKNPADFVLWKPELDGVGWDAPFGPGGSNMRGRPGWHIECSAMAKAELTDPTIGTQTETQTIDIHCGGIDLKFPHHENEIAQSNCAHGKPMANFWVHNEFLNMGNEKMSKSLGNVKLIHDLTKKWDGEVIRLALLKAHYRSELVWSESLLKESKAQLDGWYNSLNEAKEVMSVTYFQQGTLQGWKSETGKGFIGATASREADLKKPEKHPDFIANGLMNSIFSDLSTPNIIRKIAQLSGQLRRSVSEDRMPHDRAGMYKWNIKIFADLLGLLQKDPEDWFAGGLDKDKYDALVADYDKARAEAVAAKQAGDKALMGQLFARSDEIRDQLKAEGIVLETGPEGSSWRKA